MLEFLENACEPERFNGQMMTDKHLWKSLAYLIFKLNVKVTSLVKEGI